MLNDILNIKNLGATTARSSYTGRSGSSSTNTSSTNTSTTSTSTTSTTGDPYAQYITYQNSVPVVVISDGTYSFTLPLEEFTSRGNKKYTVKEALHNFLRTQAPTYEYYIAKAKKEVSPAWENKPRGGATGAYKDPRLVQSNWEHEYEELKNKAISSGDAVTVGDVLRSVKNQIFYIRPGYVYVGDSLEPAPRASQNDAASATNFLDDKGTGSDGNSNTITVGNDDDDIWWLLLPVVVGGAYLLTRKGKKKKKRK